MAYQSLLKTLQERDKLSASELKKVERVKKTSVAESLPQLLVKLGLCSELDVADAFVESGRFEKVDIGPVPAGNAVARNGVFALFKELSCCGLRSYGWGDYRNDDGPGRSICY